MSLFRDVRGNRHDGSCVGLSGKQQKGNPINTCYEQLRSGPVFENLVCLLFRSFSWGRSGSKMLTFFAGGQLLVNRTDINLINLLTPEINNQIPLTNFKAFVYSICWENLKNRSTNFLFGDQMNAFIPITRKCDFELKFWRDFSCSSLCVQ